MPLDETGFFNPRPDHQAMIIYPQHIMDHVSHDPWLCFLSSLSLTAVTAFAAEKGLRIDDIYQTTSPEITTGHLERYKHNLCVVGYSAQELSPANNKGIESLADMAKIEITSKSPYFNHALYPKVAQRLVAEKRNFESVVFLLTGAAAIGKVQYPERASPLPPRSGSPAPVFIANTLGGIGL